MSSWCYHNSSHYEWNPTMLFQHSKRDEKYLDSITYVTGGYYPMRKGPIWEYTYKINGSMTILIMTVTMPNLFSTKDLK